MILTRRSSRWPTLAALAVLLSGCALPPIVTVASFAADFASLGQTGKTISDHGLSFVAQKDCAMLRIFSNAPVCQEILDENSPEGALVTLAPLADPSVTVPPGDPMTLPREFAYLNGALGQAVASGGAPADTALPVPAFAGARDTGHGSHARPGARGLLADAGYLAAGMPTAVSNPPPSGAAL